MIILSNRVIVNQTLNIPFVLITIATVIGIILGYYISLDPTHLLLLLCSSLMVLSILWYRSQAMFHKGLGFGISIIPVFIVLGMALIYVHNPVNRLNHYTHILHNNEDTPIGIQFEIRERLKPTSFYEKYIVSIYLVDASQTEGKVLLRIPKKDSISPLAIGDIYTTYAQLKNVPKPLNPNQFDYADYLRKQYIYHQITIPVEQLIFNRSNHSSIHFLAYQFRKKINDYLSSYSFTNHQLSILNALLLGQRQDIDQTTFASYRDAGAIHLLAVSGLHVGILLYIIHMILSPFNRLHALGKKLKLFLIIILLWCFAIIAGLSPSVIRAVTMFSFLAIGIQLRSKSNIYNSVISSIFILICFRPLFIFQVGFQLSYIAVIAILYIQPLIAIYYHPKYYLDKKLWETFTVTIAAQIGVLPLSLYYFHQFPLLFFISNMIIVPVLGYILGIGIAIIILGFLHLLPNLIVKLYGKLLDVMNHIIDWVARQESFILTEISFSPWVLFISYILLITLVSSIQQFSYRKTYALVIITSILYGFLIYERHRYTRYSEMVIFHKPQKTIISVLENQQLEIYSNCSSPNIAGDYIFNGYSTQKKVNNKLEYELKNLYQFKDKTIMVIDSFGIYNINIQPDILLLSYSPKIHLGNLIHSLSPKLIIADGSNYKSYLNRWEQTCQQSSIPFHRTDTMGAFILD